MFRYTGLIHPLLKMHNEARAFTHNEDEYDELFIKTVTTFYNICSEQEQKIMVFLLNSQFGIAKAKLAHFITPADKLLEPKTPLSRISLAA